MEWVLPFDKTGYRDVVEADEAKFTPGAEWSFAALSQKAHEVPLPPPPPPERPDKQTDEKHRQECYRQAGRHLAENADVLVALWDGIYGGGMGGTGDTLAYAVSQECQQIRKQKGRTPLRVVWLAVPRQSNPHPATEAFTLGAIQPARLARFSGLAGRKLFWPVTRALLLAALFFFSVFFSLAGYRESVDACERDTISMLDHSILALSHLVMEGLTEDTGLGGGGAWQVRLGRWLAVGFAGLGLAAFFEKVFGVWAWLRRWFTAHFLPHDLICGLGWRGRALVENGSRRRPTLVIEQQPDEAARDLCRRAGAMLIEGDAGDPAILRQAGIARLRHAFVCSQDDETNMRIVHELAKLGGGGGIFFGRGKGAPLGRKTSDDQALVCGVSLKDRATAQILKDVLPENHGLDLRIFNAETVTARMLLERHPLDRFAASPDAAGARVVLIGESLMAWELFEQFLQLGHFEKGRPLSIAWLSPDPQAARDRLVARHPVYSAAEREGQPCAFPEWVWLEKQVLPVVLFLKHPSSERALVDLFEGGLALRAKKEVTSVFIALESAPESAALAALLAPVLERQRAALKRDITLTLYYNTPEDVYRDDIEQALNRDHPTLPVVVFSDFMGDCSKKAVRGDEIDRVARRLNGIYAFGLGKSLGMPIEDFDGKCVDAWSGISEADKESSRQAAAHAHVKARVRKRLIGKGQTAAAAEEALARIEHDRWCAYSLLKGFRPLTRIPSAVGAGFAASESEKTDILRWFEDKTFKNSCRRARIHADLVPFDDFDTLFDAEQAAKEKKKDMDQIQALNLLLNGLRAAD
ncbi:MAG TPA: NAD-binding protein [Prosthecobacter sp.]|nr:NAD-binding protein [Prosthecobacter sp.]HRK13024.1 NAD-binding protein [Prosthecobacter sp.]